MQPMIMRHPDGDESGYAAVMVVNSQYFPLTYNELWRLGGDAVRLHAQLSNEDEVQRRERAAREVA